MILVGYLLSEKLLGVSLHLFHRLAYNRFDNLVHRTPRL